ncbi:protein of unknown function [Hyphomicrobium sp. 1Nfss2.1]
MNYPLELINLDVAILGHNSFMPSDGNFHKGPTMASPQYSPRIRGVAGTCFVRVSPSLWVEAKMRLVIARRWLAILQDDGCQLRYWARPLAMVPCSYYHSICQRLSGLDGDHRCSKAQCFRCVKYKVPTNEQECDQLYTELITSPGDGAAIQLFLIGTNADHIMPDLCKRKAYQAAYDFAVPLIESNKQPMPKAPQQPSNCFLGSNC